MSAEFGFSRSGLLQRSVAAPIAAIRTKHRVRWINVVTADHNTVFPRGIASVLQAEGISSS
jgi:hypothetical protein